MKYPAEARQTTVEELIKTATRPRVMSQRVFGSVVEQQLFAGYEMPTFASASYSLEQPQRVGYVGGLEVRVDPMLKVPRMVVSKKFRECLPDLADDLQRWMSNFFGYEYPVYVEGNVALMHPEAFSQLQAKLAGAA
jgi:hypothetical protein